MTMDENAHATGEPQAPGATAEGGPAGGEVGSEATGQIPPAGSQPSASQEASAALLALKAQLTGLGLRNPLPALAVGAISYAVALVFSAIALLLFSLGTLLASLKTLTGDLGEEFADAADASGGGGLSGVGAVLRAPFQLVAMGAFGSYGAEATIPFAGLVSVSLRLVPFLATAALVASAYLGGRYIQRRRGADVTLRGLVDIVVSALLGGLTAAFLVIVLARITAQPVPLEELGSMSFHAAGVDAFFGAFVLVGAGLLIGRLRALPRAPWAAPLSELGAGIRLAAVHAVLLTVVVGAWIWFALAVRLIGDGDAGTAFALLLVAPLLVGQLLAFVPGLSVLSSGTAGLRGSIVEMLGDTIGEEATRTTFWIGDLPWYVWLVALLLSLGTTLGVAVLWNRARPAGTPGVLGLVVGLVAVPAGFLLVSLAQLVVGSVSLGASVGNLGSGSVFVALAAWSPAIALLVGALVEVVARFLAPLAAPFIPEVAVRWFRSGAATAAAPAVADVQGPGGEVPLGHSHPWQGGGPGTSGAVGTAPTAPGTPPAASAPRRPLSARGRRRLVSGAIGAGSLLVLIVAAVVAYNVLSATVFSPTKKVEAYLEALEAGKFGEATELSPPNAANDQRVLLTDEVGAAVDGGLTGHTVGEVTKEGDSATVAVTLDEDGKRTDATYMLTRTGRTFGIFPKWTMEDLDYREVNVYAPDEGGSVDVNGVQIDLTDIPREDDGEGYRYVALPVLPGDYTVTYTGGSPLLDQTPTELDVPAATEVDAGDQGLWVAPAQTINDDGRAAIDEELHAVLDSCAEKTDAQPEGCPFSTYTWSQQGEGSWEITGYPEYTVEPYEEGYFILSSDLSGGTASYTYTWEGFTGPEEQTDETTFTLNALVSFPDEGGVTIEFT